VGFSHAIAVREQVGALKRIVSLWRTLHYLRQQIDAATEEHARVSEELLEQLTANRRAERELDAKDHRSREAM
jgi:hypothetical protein